MAFTPVEFPVILLKDGRFTNQAGNNTMPRRINGCGTWIHPIPEKDQKGFAMNWFTLFFIPLIPLGYSLLEGAHDGSYYEIKKLTSDEIQEFIPSATQKAIIINSFVAGALYIVALIISFGVIGLVLALIFH